MPAESKRGLSATSIKLIAAAAMLVDHIAWLWFPESSAPGFIMHMFGRITAPVMCFFIAEGCRRTRNVKRYALRLLVFAVISQIPYHYYVTGKLAFSAFYANVNLSGMYNMMFTLLLGLIALRAASADRIPRALRLLTALLCCLAAYFCDWPIFGVLLVLAFGSRRGGKQHQTVLFLLICAVLFADIIISGRWGSAYYLGILLALPLLRQYNGERGGNGMSACKYAFYVFYPLHLFILALLRYCLFV